MVNFEKWSSICLSQKRSRFSTPFTYTIGMIQNRHNDIGISTIANRNNLDSLRNLGSSGQSPMKCIRIKVTCVLNIFSELTIV